ncbi:PulJ/GspJ family protein [Bacillus sp. UNC438CL73TsuS30]|uniref:PulJ/GspJ family protein n=1 Tax=Bacillus sp. UNC438CL73TsuS30 TaxID=1340434 RepID=UPI00047CE661|nr:type II secretion system protein [Bacillus sp. UNC438CL73TsuS30]
MKENFQSQKGLTLIEILVSIVLLSIILTSFMGFFTQSAIFTKKNEQKLGTVQTAQKFINLIKDISKSDLAATPATSSITTGTNTITVDLGVINQLINNSQPVKTTYTSDYTVTGVITNLNTPANLIQFKIIVQDPSNQKNKSETYTYIRKER